MEYFDTVLWMSPYKVTEQSVEVVLASQSPPHFITEKNPSGIENEIATYGAPCPAPPRPASAAQPRLV